MRHRGSVGLLVVLGALSQGKAAAGTPLDFLFGDPPLASRPAYRLRRRPAPPLTQVAPLPVPRPHFADDPPRNAQTPAPPSPPAKPAETRSGAKPDLPVPHPDATPQAPPAGKPATPPEVENPFVAPPRDKPPTASKPPPPSPPPAPPTAKASEPGPGSKTSPADTAPSAPKPATPAGSPQQPPAARAVPAGPALPPTPPPKPADLAPSPAPGKPTPPAVAPSGATLAFTPRAPDDDPQCPTRLASQKVGIEPTTLGPQPDARCTVVEPVHLDDVTMPDGSKVAFPEHPTIACVTADSFSSYVRDMLSPLAKGTFGAPVAAVWTGPGLECRSRDHVFGAKLSAHGQGLAIDIAKLKLTDGRVIEVGTPNTPAEAAFETAARAGACGYFHTVLGPGSDSYHRTHWHFDLEVRGAHGDSKYCK